MDRVFKTHATRMESKGRGGTTRLRAEESTYYFAATTYLPRRSGKTPLRSRLLLDVLLDAVNVRGAVPCGDELDPEVVSSSRDPREARLRRSVDRVIFPARASGGRSGSTDYLQPSRTRAQELEVVIMAG